MTGTAEKRAAFRALHDDGFFIIPNAWDGGSVRRLAALGFRAIASTSAGAAWAAGEADGGLGLEAMLAHLRMLVASTDLPINADFENGYGDAPEIVARNVALAVETGIAGLSIEDWSGTQMYDLPLAVARIAAARAAIDAIDPTVMLIGRTENFRVEGMTASASIARAVAYAEAGADCLFVPFIDDLAVTADLVAAVAPKPVNVIVSRFDERIAEYARIGVRRCSVGAALAGAAWGAFDAAAGTLRHYEPS
jgi:2-methylisocitrate lyase-like PEP mutase family enzyme